jgi:glycerol-3-phosphate dehydrogenase
LAWRWAARVKNVLAIAAGIVEGRGLGYNARRP